MADTLTEISVRLIRIAIPMIFLVSIIGNILNITVLGRHKMRKHSCSLYFTALSINNLMYTGSILIVNMLANGYRINLAARSLILCKLINYFGSLFSALSSSFIVLASIDRWFASSLYMHKRNVSNVRTAKNLIFTVVVSFALLFIISFVMSSANTNDAVVCRIRGNGFFIHVYSIFVFILFSCLTPILMLLFGYMTIANVHRRRRIATATVSSIYRRSENQLIRMLLVQVGSQLLFTFPICAIGLLLSFPNIHQPTSTLYALLFISRVIFHVSYATPFFLYVLSSRTYRNEFIQLVANNFRRYCHNDAFIFEHVRYRRLIRGIEYIEMSH